MYRRPNTSGLETFGGRLRDGGLPWVKLVLGRDSPMRMRVNAASGGTATPRPAVAPVPSANRASLPRTRGEPRVGAAPGQPANRASLPRQATGDHTMTRAPAPPPPKARPMLSRPGNLQKAQEVVDVVGHGLSTAKNAATELRKRGQTDPLTGALVHTGRLAWPVDALDFYLGVEERRGNGEGFVPAILKQGVETGFEEGGSAIGFAAGLGGGLPGAVAGAVGGSMAGEKLYDRFSTELPKAGLEYYLLVKDALRRRGLRY